MTVTLAFQLRVVQFSQCNSFFSRRDSFFCSPISLTLLDLHRISLFQTRSHILFLASVKYHLLDFGPSLSSIRPRPFIFVLTSVLRSRPFDFGPSSILSIRRWPSILIVHSTLPLHPHRLLDFGLSSLSSIQLWPFIVIIYSTSVIRFSLDVSPRPS